LYFLLLGIFREWLLPLGCAAFEIAWNVKRTIEEFQKWEEKKITINTNRAHMVVVKTMRIMQDLLTFLAHAQDD
jgi:hypothetical protein